LNNEWISSVLLDNNVGSDPTPGGAVAYIIYKADQTNWLDDTNYIADTGAPINPGQWNLFEMDVDLDVHEYLITLNGTPGNLITDIPDLQIGRVAVRCEAYVGKFYLDGADEVLPPIPGDADRNGTVDAADATILAGHWQMQSGALWDDGDFNNDQKVDDRDATIMAANWSGGSAAAVPEPGTIALLLSAVGSVFLVFYRQKR